MAPKSSSTAPEMRTRAPTLSSLAGLEGFTVTVAYACGRAGKGPSCLRAAPGASGVGMGCSSSQAPPGPPFAELPPEGPWSSGVDVPRANFSRCRDIAPWFSAGHPTLPPYSRPFTSSGDAGPPAQAHAWGATPSPHLDASVCSHLPSLVAQIADPGQGIQTPRSGAPGRYSPGGCKTQRRRAPPGRWALCPSSPSWLLSQEQDPGRLRARPRLCPTAPTCRAFQRGAEARARTLTGARSPGPAWASPALPTSPSSASPLSSLPSPARAT